MKIEKINSQNAKLSTWSGGTTTEFFIMPEGAEYSKRNFDIRISSAKVEVQESIFTQLNGFSRKLMVLEGEITIIHHGHYSKMMSKFDIDDFQGNWETSAIGKCTDFNLMTSSKYSGILEYHKVLASEIEKINLNYETNLFFLYCVEGDGELEIDEQKVNFKSQDLVSLTHLSSRNFNILAKSECHLVYALIKD